MVRGEHIFERLQYRILRGSRLIPPSVLEARDSAWLLPEMLPFIMQLESFHSHSVARSKGSVNPYVNFSDIACFEFLLPPIQEQARLVEAMKAMEETSEQLFQLALSSKRLRQAAIDYFANDETEQQATLGALCQMQNGHAFPGEAYTTEGIRLLRPGNLGVSGYLHWNADATEHLPLRFEMEAEEYIVDQGDLVINLTAQSLEEGFMGRVCLAREGDKSLLNQRIGRFRGFSRDVLPEFMFRVLQSSRFQTQAIRMCEGSKIKHLFWEHLAPFKLPVPDIEKQKKAIDLCSAIDDRLQEAQVRRRHVFLDRSNLFDQAIEQRTSQS